MNSKRHFLTFYFAQAIFCSVLLYVPLNAQTANCVEPGLRATIVYGYTPQIFYEVDLKDAKGLIETWARLAESKMQGKYTILTVTFKTMAEAEVALNKKKVDILILIPEEFIRMREKCHLVPIMSAEYGDHFYNDLVMLVHADSGITRIEELLNKSLFIDNGQQGSIPLKWLDSVLEALSFPNASVFFSKIAVFNKADRALMPVFFGKADASLISRIQYETIKELNPQIGSRLRIVESSPGFVTGIVAVREDLTKTIRNDIVTNLENAHNDPKGQQMLTLFRINKLVPFKPEHLTSVENLLIPGRDKLPIAAKSKQ